MSTGRVHHFKPHAPLHEALKWLLEHDTNINGTIIFETNSSLMLVDGKYDSVDIDDDQE